VALVLLAWGAAIVLAPSQAQSPCLETEDGRCVAAPALADDGPRLGARPEGRPTSIAAGPAVLVRRRDAVSPSHFGALLQAGGSAGAQGLGLHGWWRVSPAPGETIEALTARLRAMPEVAYAEEDTHVQASYLPNDPRLADQWALPVVEADMAWDDTMGHDDVWIAVVDTGVDDTHPDAPSDLWWGWDFANDDGDPWDDNGHGIHVAGIAAAATDNAQGVAGLCPDCDLLAVKVLADDGRGWNSDVADGIAFAAYWGHYYDKRTIINLSLGGGYSVAVADAVAYAQSLGALVVAAAGNDGPQEPQYPAALDGVLAVAATDEDDTPAWFSQYGDIAAPGVYILSTVPDGYQYYSGTSMASPMVAGAAGLVWSLDPSLTATGVSDRLLANVDVPTGWNSAYGAGRLNAARALAPEPSPTPTDTATPTPPATDTATPEPTPTFTATPEATPISTATPEPTPTSTATPEAMPTSTATPAPSATPTAVAGPGPTIAPPTIPAPTATTIVALPGAPTPEPYVLTLPLLMLER